MALRAVVLLGQALGSLDIECKGSGGKAGG
jgi:hypothetical protein